MVPETVPPRQEVGDTDLRPQPVTSDAQPTEAIVQEPTRKESLSKETVSLEDKLPAQTKIAFTSFRGQNFGIYVMNADGSDQTRLTNNPAPDSGPSWSPDGKKIAFMSRSDENLDIIEIYVMNTDGSMQNKLTNNYKDIY